MIESAVETLANWEPGRRDQRLYAEYLAFAEESAHTWRESSIDEHLTVSAFIFNAALSEVLLCFHKKGLFWLQLGGHIEPADPSLLEAARREASEESGLTRLTPLTSEPVDISRHELSSGFGTCKVHWDIGFAFVSDPRGDLVVSDESEDVRWCPVDRLPTPLAGGVRERISAITGIFATR